MDRSERTILTNMCMVYDQDGNVLVQNRIDPEWGGITFPGGHVEKGESFVESVIREVSEETGLCIEKPRLCGIKQWQKDEDTRYIVLLYKTDLFEGEVRSSDEGEVFWVKFEELERMKMARGMDKTMRVLMEDQISEFYHCKAGEEWIDELK